MSAKLIVVPPFQQMHHLMYQNILQALHWFLRQLQIEPDAPRLDITAPPFRLHLSDAPPSNRYTHNRLPFGDKVRNPFLEDSTIPLIQHQLPIGAGGVGIDGEQELLVVFDDEAVLTWTLCHF